MEVQYISLNMTPTGVNPCFHISQYDVGRILGFIVHSGGATVDLDTYTCTVEATRSDGTAITSVVATNDNIGTFEVTPTMSNKADKYRCQLVIVDENSKRIASLPFDMEVTKAAMDENSESIEEDASLYQQYTEAVQRAIAEVNADIQAEENARIAAVNAEATARANADTTLQNNIDAEAEARANAITAEATARQTADNTLQGNIDSEASARQVADNMLQSNINAEASTRATQDASLQSQIDNIIAPSGEAPSAAEVTDARIGADGITYSSLGTATRTQVKNLKCIDNYKEGSFGRWLEPSNLYNSSSNKIYRVDNKTEENLSNGCYQSLDGLVSGMGLMLNGYSYSAPNRYPFYAFFDSSNNLINMFGGASIGYENHLVIVPDNASKIIVNGNVNPANYYPASIKVFYKDDIYRTFDDTINSLRSAIIWDDISNITISETTGVINFKDGSTQNVGKHITVNVLPIRGKIVALSGKSYTVSSPNYLFCLAGAYDSNGVLIETYGNTSNQDFDYFSIRIPNNAASLVINGSLNGKLSIKKASETKATNEIYQKALDAYDYIIADNVDSNSHLFVSTEPSYVSGGRMDFHNNEVYGTTYGKKYNVSEGEQVLISGSTSSVSSNMNYNVYGFYDSDMNLLAVSQYTQSQTVYENISVTVPNDAVYCYVNGTSQYTPVLYVISRPDIKQYIDNKTGLSSWLKGKKVGVLGTSVAFGQLADTSYSYEAAKKLGFELKMFAVPGLAIETQLDGSPMSNGSFTLSKSEYSDAGITIADNPIPYMPNGSYNNYYRTYENVFTAANADIDLWIYAVIPNNTKFSTLDWDAFDKNNWKYSDDSSFAEHRKTFMGAMLFIMDKMYELNPNARMLMVIDSSFGYSSGKECFELLKGQWNMPIIDLWGNINISPKSLVKLKSENGTNNHPSTFAHQIMGVMFSEALNMYA